MNLKLSMSLSMSLSLGLGLLHLSYLQLKLKLLNLGRHKRTAHLTLKRLKLLGLLPLRLLLQKEGIQRL